VLLLLLLRLCNRGSYLQDHHDRDNGYTLRSIVGSEGRYSLSVIPSLAVEAEPNPEPQPEVWLPTSNEAWGTQWAICGKQKTTQLASLVRNQEDEAMRGPMAVDGAASRRGIRGQRTIPSGYDTEEARVAPGGQ
jgi:hypothetical protein